MKRILIILVVLASSFNKYRTGKGKRQSRKIQAQYRGLFSRINTSANV